MCGGEVCNAGGDLHASVESLDLVFLTPPLQTKFCCFQAFFDQDIVVNFPEHGMHLRFEPRSQRLRLVEVYDVSRLQVSPAFQQHVLTLPEG